MSSDSGNGNQPENVPTEKSFGLTFAAVFALIGLLPLVHGGHVRYWALLVSLSFGLITFVAPALLRRPNRLWARFGALLHKIVNPLVLSLLFVIVILPMALALRILRVKLMPLDFEPESQTYWVKRDPAGPTPESLRNQF